MTYDLARAIHSFQITPQNTVTLIGDEGLKRDDGTPQQAGDVLSVQPDGSQQARAKGTNGAFEVIVQGSAIVTYAPLGKSGHAFVLPFVSAIPNV